MSQHREEDMQHEEISPEFEADLTRALRRVDAPAGFADRVMAAQVKQRPPARLLTMRPWQHAWVSGAIAAALVVGIVGTAELHQRHERQQAAVAQQQFEAAIRITGDALDHVREQLGHAGIELGN